MYHDFSNTCDKAQIFEIDELGNKETDTIFVPTELLDNEEVLQKISKESKFTPIKPISTEILNLDSFENLNEQEALELTEKVNVAWVLQNNLALLENLFENINHLKMLWPNDRTTFFEELWYLLKNNLGSKNLKLAYNHLQKAKKDSEKNQLIRVVIAGKKLPNPTENKELGDALFTHYEGQFNQNFNVHSYEEESGKLVILGSINNSPLIIMAEGKALTKLQKALLKSLFDGLQILK